MPQLLSLSRAARIAGVSRGELQKRIRHGELETFEGSVRISDLLRTYPKIDLDTDKTLEKVEFIKAIARPKRVYTDGLPSAEMLLSRVHHLTQLLMQTKSALNRSEQLIQEILNRLRAAAGIPSDAQRELIAELSGALEKRLSEQESEPDERAKVFVKDAFLRVMAANVKIIPSGHEFFVEGTETILEASVRSGLHLNYGCSSGNCGNCKARVVNGEVWRIRDHDYLLSEREQAMGYLLTCCNTAVTDVVLEAGEALSPGDLPTQQIRAVLKKIEPISESLFLLRLQTPRTQTLRFLAGQRASLELEDGSSAELSIASCPCDSRNLQFLVWRRDGEPFSDAVFGSLKPGQTIGISGPIGEFVLEDDSSNPIVFVAAGPGFAPVKSLIEHAISIDIAEKFAVYWAAEASRGTYLERLCRSWDDALDNFHFQPFSTITDPEEIANAVRDQELNTDEVDLYVAGPDFWVERFLSALKSTGARPSVIRTERT